MNTSRHDPISTWMQASQAPIPIQYMEDLVLADIRALHRANAQRRRYLAFAWVSFLIGAVSGLWIASPIYADLLHPTSEFLVQLVVSVALMFGFNQLWQQSRELKKAPDSYEPGASY